MSFDLVVRSRRMVLPDGMRPAALGVSDGRIAAVLPFETPAGVEATVVLPGLVDTHVHVNEPGRADWEGFESATQAAAAGGITTLIDMPLNSNPVTISVAALERKREAAAGRCWIDTGFWGGIIPGNSSELPGLAAAGVFGFKCFLIASGLDEFPPLDEEDLRRAMRTLAPLDLPLLVHAELDLGASVIDDSRRRYARFLSSRPSSWEDEAAALVARLAGETGCRAHIVHVSSASAALLIAAARMAGTRLSGETCPHYLYFAAEEIPPGRTDFKCCPPIRDLYNRERLWSALKGRALDFVVSDHSPCAPELKRLEDGDFDAAWGGISSLQFALPALWTEASRRGFSLLDVARWMSEHPAVFAGLPQKGALAVGRDADFVLFDPEAYFTVTRALVLHRHKLTPYEGRRLNGIVSAVYQRGQPVFRDGHFAPRPGGRLLRREAHELHGTH